MGTPTPCADRPATGPRPATIPVAAPSAGAARLPAEVASFVGRRTELSEIGRLLSASRLLTLVGPGGVGKTMTTAPHRPDLLPAAYLRCPLGATAALQGRREALRGFAARLGLPAPVFYEDYLVPGADPDRSPPRFEALTRAVHDGSHRLLLLPSPWALGSTQARARAALRLLTAAGCGRILMLPTPVRPVRPGRGRYCAALSRAPVRRGLLP